jgi:DNA topoisomerase-2
VGGRNGYGAKLANIFSTRFCIETYDGKSGRLYKQVWEKNMSVCHKPDISTPTGKKLADFTQVSFEPDYERFGMVRGQARGFWD